MSFEDKLVKSTKIPNSLELGQMFAFFFFLFHPINSIISHGCEEGHFIISSSLVLGEGRSALYIYELTHVCDPFLMELGLEANDEVLRNFYWVWCLAFSQLNWNDRLHQIVVFI